MHKYSINEIDALRVLCRNKVIWGDYKPSFDGKVRWSAAYDWRDLSRRVEDMVRTFMANETKPEDF